jgi:hypothetical protein
MTDFIKFPIKCLSPADFTSVAFKEEISKRLETFGNHVAMNLNINVSSHIHDKL